MRKRYWNRKVSALLLAGLVLSALPVHAFAEEAQKNVEAAASAEQEVSEEKDADTGITSDVNTNSSSDAGIDTEAGEEQETETEASSDGKSDAENLTEMSSASGTENAVQKTETDIRTEENTAEVSEKKAEAAEEEKTATVEELTQEILPEEPSLASASDIPMATDTEAEDVLLGTWTVDGYTSLAFYGDGKGAMLLPTASYNFHYTLNDDQLELDFVSSRARDMRYTITLDTDTLQLTSGTGTKSVTISLQRVE